MNGLWTEETKNLALSVADGCIGALQIINELLYFSKWFGMMKWCEKNLKGSELWKKYKDNFNCQFMDLGYWIKKKMCEEDKKVGDKLCISNMWEIKDERI